MKTVFVLSSGRTGTHFLAHYFNSNYDNVVALHEPKSTYLFRRYSNAYIAGKVPRERMIGVLRGARREVLDSLQTDTYIESILVCPAHEEALFIAGQHMVDIGLEQMQNWSVKASPWKTLVQNKDPRYHYLAGDQQVGIGVMIIDFKHFFTIPRARLCREYADSFVGAINPLFRELLSQRFANFLSRIGLPN